MNVVRILFVVALLALLLCGCGATSSRVEFVRPVVAPSLLQCKPEPEPLGPGARQRDVAPYVIDLAEAGADCRRKLGTVKNVLEEPAR